MSKLVAGENLETPDVNTCRQVPIFDSPRDFALNDVDKDTRLLAPRQLSAQPSPQPSAAELVPDLHATHRRS